MTEAEIRQLIRQETQFRTGLGFDVHEFAEGRKCILGGVEIPHSQGLLGHSDADVVVHAAMDAALGAAGLPDIGHFFPNTSEEFRGADSLQLARRVTQELKQRGYELCNLDVMVMAEAPKVGPHREQMRANLAEVFALPLENVALKATTMEKMGFVGRREGVAVIASALARRTS
ncbi:2-C-methyl-D-erythritol 2,4-cyclodiphosphate synthase [bacterium]|nr:2-C-methyl-D-erythritol 2,4-cyclodiphosphate synthase [bacterium]